jgi:hypothetical protein
MCLGLACAPKDCGGGLRIEVRWRGGLFENKVAARKRRSNMQEVPSCRRSSLNCGENNLIQRKHQKHDIQRQIH